MSQIQEYNYKGHLCYKGKVICPRCSTEYELNTIDKNKFIDLPVCFECFMNDKE